MQKVSVVITVLNEEKSIRELIKALLAQDKKPQEIIIVDGGSSDKTVQIIKESQNQDKRIKLIVEESSRSEGRNIGVEVAKNEIIAITDADCSADKNWLKNISKPFQDGKIDMVAGFYKMVAFTPFQKALSVFIGISPDNFDEGFLPSTRSIAFRKSLWRKIGGFKGGKDNTAEDTIFNYQAIIKGANIIRKKDALVNWHISENLFKAMKKFYIYAQWDAQSRILWHPAKKLFTHNIKVILVYIRYLLGAFLLFQSVDSIIFRNILIISIITYCFWSFRKVLIQTSDYKAGFWGILLQFSSDIAVMSGAFTGLLKRKTTIG